MGNVKIALRWLLVVLALAVITIFSIIVYSRSPQNSAFFLDYMLGDKRYPCQGWSSIGGSGFWTGVWITVGGLSAVLSAPKYKRFVLWAVSILGACVVILSSIAHCCDAVRERPEEIVAKHYIERTELVLPRPFYCSSVGKVWSCVGTPIYGEVCPAVFILGSIIPFVVIGGILRFRGIKMHD